MTLFRRPGAQRTLFPVLHFIFPILYFSFPHPFALAAVYLLALVPSVGAIELWSRPGDERYCALNTALKWTSLLSHAPQDAVLYPERWSATALQRMRLSFKARPASWMNAEIAYEQRARIVSERSGAGGASGILLSENRAPYRISQIDAPLVEIGRAFSYRHELDRASVAIAVGRTEITVGRQAVGWGRGVLFGAVDIFAPFSPLESDREWRRGIDAVRAGIPLTDLISLDAVAAIGKSPDASTFAGRLRGYVGVVDGEIIFGRRYRDYLYAATASCPVYNAEAHGEIAFFRTPEAFPDGGVLGRDNLMAVVAVGASYNLDVGCGLLLRGDYHFSGFGVSRIEDAGERLANPSFRERYLRGDMQILGRHAVALQTSYALADGTMPVSGVWIVSPADGSGVLTLTLSWLFSDNLTLAASAYVPHGAGPTGGRITSEYGGLPASGLMQISFYY